MALRTLLYLHIYHEISHSSHLAFIYTILMIDHHLNRSISIAICHPPQLLLFFFSFFLHVLPLRNFKKPIGQSIQNHVELKRKARPWLLKAIRDKKVSSLTNAFSLLTVGVTHKFNNFLVIVRITLRLEAAEANNRWSLRCSSTHLSIDLFVISAIISLHFSAIFLLHARDKFSPPVSIAQSFGTFLFYS